MGFRIESTLTHFNLRLFISLILPTTQDPLQSPNTRSYLNTAGLTFYVSYYFLMVFYACVLVVLGGVIVIVLAGSNLLKAAKIQNFLWRGGKAVVRFHGMLNAP